MSLDVLIVVLIVLSNNMENHLLWFLSTAEVSISYLWQCDVLVLVH